LVTLQPDDEAAVLRCFGLQEIPAELAEEIALVTRMFHAAGHSGSIGTLAVILSGRRLGYSPPKRKAPVQGLWSSIAAGTRVECFFLGTWRDGGTFIGLGQNGVLLIQDASGHVSELYPHVVRVAGDPQAKAPEPKPAETKPSEAKAEKRKAEKSKPEPPPAIATVQQPIDWSAIPIGKVIWVDLPNGDVADATFQGVSQEVDGKAEVIRVRLDGEIDLAEFAAKHATLGE
jgi:hypothetical protein